MRKTADLPKELKASAAYVFSSFFVKGIAIITVPIFTRLMPSNEVGIVNLFNSWASLILVITTFALTSGGFSLAMKEFEQERSQYTSAVLTLTSFGALLFGVTYLLFPEFWQHFIGLPSILMILLILYTLFYPAYNFWLLRQRYEYKFMSTALVTISASILSSAASIYAVIAQKKAGYTALAQASLLANYTVMLSIAAILWLRIFLQGKTFCSIKYWRFALPLSLPLMGNSLAEQVLSSSDRIMIGHIINESAVGIYGTLYSCSSTFLLVWGAINTSFIPFLFDNLDKPAQEKKIKTLATTLLSAAAIAAFLMTLLAPEIVLILAPPEYQEAIYIMPPIAGGVFMISISNTYSNLLVYYKKTKHIMISTAIAATVNVILNYIFLPIYGYVAAAYTTLFSYIVCAVIQAGVSIQVCESSRGKGHSVYEAKFIFSLCAIALIGCLLCIPLYNTIAIRYLLVFIILLLAFCKRKHIIAYVQNLHR